ncbi:L-threonylcarbamoyladenylate synthase [Candidatus Avelusimicrobium alvi]|uniref:L-threonylcarbamoyladenylate synthase n=1 Tax=Candidatus Avelusimicrobium alvi TaxID=3416221 RepID=UPI003D0A531B
MRRTHIFKTVEMTDEYLEMAARAVDGGAVAVVPTDTVYGIGTGAFCEPSIEEIYRIKERPAGSPLQILTGTLAQAREVAVFSEAAEKLAAAYWPGALTAILPPAEKGRALTRGFAGLGLRVPGNAFLVSLLARMKAPLACTSANLHGQPVLTDERTILETFDGKVDFIFLGGTLSPTASSVVDLTAEPLLLREGGVPRAELEKTLGFRLGVK